MEWSVLITGILLRFLYWLLDPIWGWWSLGGVYSVPPNDDPILHSSAVALAKKIRCGLLSSEKVVSTFINRVKEVDPYLNAVVEDRFEEALEEAREVDRKLVKLRATQTEKEIEKSLPFLGVPFTVKESCSLKGLSNAVGCYELEGSQADSDGTAVRLVRESGAIPLLVSNTPELCLGWETSNLVTGITRNPYCLAKTAGGSSGGEAALVASCASVMSVSSDIAGSIRIPAAFCGVFGHKPTPGIIGIEGHIPSLSDELFPKFLTLGPLARTTEDLEALFRVMAGDNAQKLRLDTSPPINKIRIFYMTEVSKSLGLIKVDESIRNKLEQAVKYLETISGATIMQEKFKDLEDSVDMSVSVFFSMNDLPNMLTDLKNPKEERNIFIEFFKLLFGIGTRSLQGLTFAFINKTKLFIPKKRHTYYKDKANRLGDHITNTLGTNGVLLYPAFVGPAHYHYQVFVKACGVMYSMMFNILGMPVTTVPLGLHDGMPISIQVIAAPNQDRLCLAVAKELEIGFGGFQDPEP